MPAEKAKQPSIECAKNGPYLVRGVETFTNSQGDAIPTRRTIALCRCGASKNKPFCDGSHDRVGFNSNKRDGRVEDQLDIFPGEGITIRDNRGICSHAGFCTDGCPAVWRERDGSQFRSLVTTDLDGRQKLALFDIPAADGHTLARGRERFAVG